MGCILQGRVVQNRCSINLRDGYEKLHPETRSLLLIKNSDQRELDGEIARVLNTCINVNTLRYAQLRIQHLYHATSSGQTYAPANE